MKILCLIITLLVCAQAGAKTQPINLQYSAVDRSVENVSLPKIIDLDELGIQGDLFSPKLRFFGKVDGRKLELIIPLEKINEDSKFFYVRAVVVSEQAVEEVCGRAWQRELILEFRINRLNYSTSEHRFEGYFASTWDNCHSPEEVQNFIYTLRK